MDLRIFTEPQQGASYDTLLAVAKATEDLGFDAFFRSDHYLKMGSVDGLPGPTDAWITLAGLARETKRIRLGTLVSPVTFRLPGVLAIQAAQVDAMSGGRVELGLGAGWFDDEHTAYGIPFPANRFGLLRGGVRGAVVDADDVGERQQRAGDDARDDLGLVVDGDDDPDVVVAAVGPGYRHVPHSAPGRGAARAGVANEVRLVYRDSPRFGPKVVNRPPRKRESGSSASSFPNFFSTSSRKTSALSWGS
jgi:Luciferase-like monooxygenase